MRTEDGYIIQQCLDGDSAAFGFLVEKYKRAVYALAYSRIGNFHDAQDITQEAFIKAYRKLRTLRRWDSFMGWLCRITASECKLLIRARSRYPDSELIEDQSQDIIDHHSVNSYRDDTVYESIRETVASLPEVYRQVVTLRYFGGMTVNEMARFLSVSPNTIDRRLREARLRLKEEMLAMMNTAYEQHELSASFIFRIIEMVKRIRINPIPRTAGLPWGLSLALGIITMFLSSAPYVRLSNPITIPEGSPLPVETKVMKTGEVPVDVIKLSKIWVISSKRGDGDGGELRPADERSDFLLAPQASEVKLKPGNGAAGDRFGVSVRLHGDYAIVGAYSKDDGKGVAYIFKRDGDSWKEQEMLLAGDGGKNDGFGDEVAISDEFAVVGAPYDDDMGEDTGSVYIFRRTGESWTQQAKLNPHGQAIKWCNFGIAVAVSGDYLVVGSHQEEGAGGAIYIFKRDGDAWVEQAKLKSSNWAQFDRFGQAVSISGDYVIAGAPMRNNNTGSAYIFKRDDAWKEQAILTVKDGKVDDWFGFSVSISGDYAIVGANGVGGEWKGAVYIFIREGTSWRQQAKIVPDDLAVGDCFGEEVCIYGDRAIVGSSFVSHIGGKGVIYGFMRDGDSWKQVSKLTASDGAKGDLFGRDVAFSGNYAIVGSPGADVNGADSGAAYIYHCTEDLLFPALPVENSGFSPTTLGREKSKIVIPDAAILPPAVPKKSRLLQNFPNPFNPETWLPYELSSEATVMIDVYNVRGEPARRLSQGRQKAGSYVTKDKAAYWDGRDEAGNYVSSGVYFYTIRAGDFVATKKMVVAK